MSRYEELFEPVAGVGLEAFMIDAGDLPYGTYQIGVNRNAFWDAMQRILSPDGPNANKIQLINLDGLNEETIRRSFLAYLIFSGPNAFFFPVQAYTSWTEYPPSSYADLKNVLGSPVAHPECDDASDWYRRGYRLWWRHLQGGIAYLNLSESKKTVTLPGDRPYFDPSGNQVSHITLEDMGATYVTTEPGERIAKPRINPRRPGLVTDPLTITLETEPFTPASESTIVYTLDGSEPDEHSTMYVGPFEIHESCVVKAKAFPSVAGRRWRTPPLASFTNQATYRLTDELPIVEFHRSACSGSEFLEHDYPVVSLSHVSGQPVTVRYEAVGGTATLGVDYILQPGIVTFRPGEQYQYFYLRIINDSESEPDETIVVALSYPVNAVLGDKTRYTYTIEDNDRQPMPMDIVEDFETGSFSMLDWRYSGDARWVVASDEAYSGNYSARAGVIGANQRSTLEVTAACYAGEIRFAVKTSSELHWDKLVFKVDGVERSSWSGEQDWIQVSFPVSAGVHTFEWTYEKDGSLSHGMDTAWIDDISVPVQSL